MNLLQLEGYDLHSATETEHDFHLRVTPVKKPVYCQKCFRRDLVGFGKREQVVKDLPRLGKRTAVYVTASRWRCKKCGSTCFDELPHVNERRQMTQRLVSWIGQQAVSRTFAAIAEEVGVTEGTIRRMFSDYVQDAYDDLRIDTPRWLGIDEIYLIKPRCVLTNVEERTAVDILPTRNKDAVVKRLCDWIDRRKVELVTIDMWRPYRDACRIAIPNATVIVDKFHVLRMANEAVERVRKSLRSGLTKHQRRGLVNDRWLMLKRRHDLTERDQMMLSGWLLNYPDLAAAYEVKEAAYEIYDAASSEEAKDRYAQWRADVPQTMRGAFGDFQRAWDNWETEISAYFDNRITNAYTESLNNLIRTTNRIGRGYSFDALRAKILLSEGGQKVRRPKFQRMTGTMGREVPDGIFPANLGIDLSTLWRAFNVDGEEPIST